MRKIISTLLIIAGIIIILIPITGSIYTSYRQDKLYDEYLKNQLKNSMEKLNTAFGTNPSVSEETPTATSPSYKPAVIGRIKIPSVSIDLILVEGTSSQDLKWGAGHVTGTAMPGEIGNCAIAGHRNYTFGTYFSRLGEVKIGDIITVEYNMAEYTYEAFEILTVLPDDISVLAQPEDASILTLITCTPRGSDTHRLIIHAKLIS